MRVAGAFAALMIGPSCRTLASLRPSALGLLLAGRLLYASPGGETRAMERISEMSSSATHRRVPGARVTPIRIGCVPAVPQSPSCPRRVPARGVGDGIANDRLDRFIGSMWRESR